MASGNTVEVRFAGDASGFNRVVKQVAENSEESAGRMGRAFDKAGSAADSSESKFMGMADLLDGLGGAFGLPTEGATNMMRAFGDMSGGFAILQPAIAGVKGAFAAMNATMLANPVFLIIAGIVALGAALVIAYQKSETFRNIVDAAFRVVKSGFDVVWGVAQAVFGWFANNWQTILTFITGPIGLAVRVISGHWDQIMAGVRIVGDVIRSVFDGAWQGIRWVFNQIARAWNSGPGKIGFSIPDWVPGVGGKRFDIPDIPMLAAGGIVTRPTLAVVGEAGPEAVVPLSRGGTAGIGGNTFNITVNALDPRSAEQAVVKALEGFFTRGGAVTDGRGRTLRPV